MARARSQNGDGRGTHGRRCRTADRWQHTLAAEASQYLQVTVRLETLIVRRILEHSSIRRLQPCKTVRPMRLFPPYEGWCRPLTRVPLRRAAVPEVSSQDCELEEVDVAAASEVGARDL